MAKQVIADAYAVSLRAGDEFRWRQLVEQQSPVFRSIMPTPTCYDAETAPPFDEQTVYVSPENIHSYEHDDPTAIAAALALCDVIAANGEPPTLRRCKRHLSGGQRGPYFVDSGKGGQPRLYCSDACKQATYRLRRVTHEQ